ncbi:Uncharacterised protein [Legionella steigerwaltii]|uniref:Transmembrane protein n=1 Tax=Legionella steigerwaltii TaxID=460 RepID=A0A378L7F4_9GAMM|nr:hypothetical protein [Legionella steigerwaltii]KTD77118.1 hypothetical protein Lstg_2210 [Legionella steigerwaltii]STY21609.1 Uncharacterised protein [Legionella steigerwaltii]
MFTSQFFNRLNSHWLVFTLFFIFASLWLMNTWGPAPIILTNGDAGNVSSIVASNMNPERFVQDPLFSDAQNFKFYWTISVPLTQFITYFTHDIGQAYLLLIWPIIFVQLIGFYLLGLYLFSNKGWAFLLAILSLSPVFVFPGELWGQLDVPLTRSYYGVLFPFILFLSLKKNNKIWLPFVVMGLCGLSVYVHPVSAPSVSFACLTALFMCKPTERSWLKQLSVIFAAGVMFLVVAAPFIISFFSGFPSSENIHNNSSSAIAAHYMTEAAGPQYYNVLSILNSLYSLLFQGKWSWFWLIGLIGLLIVPTFSKKPYYERKFFIFFIVGLLISSVGIAWLDQSIARMYGRYPAEIDLVRNSRYLIPLLLIGGVRFFASINIKILSKYRPAFWFLILIFVYRWFIDFPTTFTTFLVNQVQHKQTENLVNNSSNKKMLNYIKSLPTGSKIMAFSLDSDSNGLIEDIMLAIRYSSFQPIAHLRKDLNFLSYSGRGLQILEWQKEAEQLALIKKEDDQSKLKLLKEFMQAHKVNLLLVYEPDVSAELRSLFNSQFELLYKQINFSLYAYNPNDSKIKSAHQDNL